MRFQKPGVSPEKRGVVDANKSVLRVVSCLLQGECGGQYVGSGAGRRCMTVGGGSWVVGGTAPLGSKRGNGSSN
jgi:hypothetical protein